MEDTAIVVSKPVPVASTNGQALAPIDTAAVGVAAQVEAQIRARYALAIARPRDVDNVRTKILKACARPKFAESARYCLPRGGRQIEGPSIRFAEEAARSLGNVSIDAAVVHDDAERRLVRVTVVDVEANLPMSMDVVIEKFVERNQLRQGQEAISSRTNSQGRVVYRIVADEGELVIKQAALVSKAMRNLVLRILPADILEEAMEVCLETMSKQDAQDPETGRKKLLDAFASVGVKPQDLKIYTGTDLAHIDVKTMQELRDLYTALKEGAITWPEAVSAKQELDGKDKAKEAAKDAPKTLDEMTRKRKE